METTLITDKCYACEYEKYCERSYCCLRNSRFTETIIDKTQKGEQYDRASRMGDCLVCGRWIVFYNRANNKMDLLCNKKEIVMAQYINKAALVAEIERIRAIRRY